MTRGNAYRLIAVAAMLVILASWQLDNREGAGTVIAVSAVELEDDYRENEFAADLKYKGKTLILSGEVATVQEAFGRKYITLKSKGMFAIQCFFDESQTSKLAALKSGRNVLVEGECGGMGLNVEMRNCRVR
jgi:hypothetical protein